MLQSLRGKRQQHSAQEDLSSYVEMYAMFESDDAVLWRVQVVFASCCSCVRQGTAT